MEFERQRDQETWLQVENILTSDADPIAKVQEIVDLGYDEEVASELVERYQIGQSSVVYYEQLPQYRDE